MPEIKALESADEILNRVDASIRAGDLGSARIALKGLKREKIPRPLLWRVANGWRRCGQPNRALATLSRYVRNEKRQHRDASPKELSEYGAALNDIGAHSEALQLLHSVSKTDEPSARLFEGFARISRWEYAESIPVLREFLGATGITPYQRLVGEVNLASALVYVRRADEARELLSELSRRAESENNRLLGNNILELSIFNELFSGETGRARELSAEARRRVQDSRDDFFQILAHRSAVVCDLYGGRRAKTEALTELREVRGEAARIEQWETVRETDWFLARFERSAGLYNFVWRGSPYASFRAMLAADYASVFGEGGGSVEPFPAPSFVLRLGKRTRGEMARIDAATGENSGGKGFFKKEQVTGRLFRVLCEDFYRPISTGTLHARLFPDRFYNPNSSPVLIRQAMKRLRAWLRENKLPIEIANLENFYRLDVAPGAGVSIDLGGIALESLEKGAAKAAASYDRRLVEFLRKIEAKSHGRSFSSGEASRFSKSSDRSASRYLKLAVEAGLASRAGEGRATRYTLDLKKAR